MQLVCDPVSYEFVRGATVDYTTDIIRSAFEVRCGNAHGTMTLLKGMLTLSSSRRGWNGSCLQVVTNPNAQASCGCGSSFAPKD